MHLQAELTQALATTGQAGGSPNKNQSAWYLRELALWYTGLAQQDYFGLQTKGMEGYARSAESGSAMPPTLAAFSQFTAAELGMAGQALRPLYLRGE